MMPSLLTEIGKREEREESGEKIGVVESRVEGVEEEGRGEERQLTSESGGSKHVHSILREDGGGDVLEAAASSSVNTEPPLGTAGAARSLVHVSLPRQLEGSEQMLLIEPHLEHRETTPTNNYYLYLQFVYLWRSHDSHYIVT